MRKFIISRLYNQLYCVKEIYQISSNIFNHNSLAGRIKVTSYKVKHKQIEKYCLLFLNNSKCSQVYALSGLGKCYYYTLQTGTYLYFTQIICLCHLDSPDSVLPFSCRESWNPPILLCTRWTTILAVRGSLIDTLDALVTFRVIYTAFRSHLNQVFYREKMHNDLCNYYVNYFRLDKRVCISAWNPRIHPRHCEKIQLVQSHKIQTSSCPTEMGRKPWSVGSHCEGFDHKWSYNNVLWHRSKRNWRAKDASNPWRI